VSAEARGKGLARYLMQSMEQIGRHFDFPAAMLTVLKSTVDLILFNTRQQSGNGAVQDNGI
jgi:hypothetical protein